MPNLIGSGLSQNYLKTSPSTRFGTRQLQRVNIYVDADILTDYLESNSLYSRLVRALQQNVELYEVAMPNPAFFSCYGQNAFQITIAGDTAVDLWNSTNSFIDDGDPVNWYFGSAVGADTNDNLGNEMTKPLYAIIYDALDAAGVSTNCWVAPTWTVGDMTWPSNGNTVQGGGAPQLANPASEELSFGDSAMTRLRKIANWLKTLNP
jgi:hypothetical protein